MKKLSIIVATCFIMAIFLFLAQIHFWIKSRLDRLPKMYFARKALMLF